MDEHPTPDDFYREDVVIFVAEGIVCERLGVAMDRAVVALADMAVIRGLTLVEMARQVVAGAVDPLDGLEDDGREGAGDRARPHR